MLQCYKYQSNKKQATLKRGMTEWKKIVANPKGRNGRKLPQILKGGIK